MKTLVPDQAMDLAVGMANILILGGTAWLGRTLAETFGDIIASGDPWDGRQLASGLSATDEASLLAH